MQTKIVIGSTQNPNSPSFFPHCWLLPFFFLPNSLAVAHRVGLCCQPPRPGTARSAATRHDRSPRALRHRVPWRLAPRPARSTAAYAAAVARPTPCTRPPITGPPRPGSRRCLVVGDAHIVREEVQHFKFTMSAFDV